MDDDLADRVKRQRRLAAALWIGLGTALTWAVVRGSRR